jgi:Fe-Mn family superoxide dismutase
MATGQSRREVLKAGSLALLGISAAGNTAATAVASGAAETQNVASLQGAYKNNSYTLPPLPYGYDALEPLYDEKTLRIHHDKHHAGYVKGLNSTLEKLEAARKAGDYSSIKALSRDLAFNGSGHVLHTLFWNSMNPAQPGVPNGLAEHLAKSFGSVEAAKSQFAAATKAVEGSGWGLLVYEPIADKLFILQAEKHQDLAIWGAVPLLVCDVWEHAYYLQYANDRGTWVDNFMKMANWPFAAARLEGVCRAMGRM